MTALGSRLFHSYFGKDPALASEAAVRKALEDASAAAGPHKFTIRFLLGEWRTVVDAWQIETWDAYKGVSRLGKKTRLPEVQRAVVWFIFESLRQRLASLKIMTESAMFSLLTQKLIEATRSPYDFIVIDEAQDVSVAQL